MKRLLAKARLALLFGLPIVVFFTNFPIIKLGENSSMFFELSLPIIWLACFDIASLCKIPQIVQLCKRHPRVTLLSCLAITWPLISCFWSPNPLRGGLNSGLILAIFFAILSIFSDMPNKKSLGKILRIYLLTSTILSLFCILQGFLDVFDIQKNLLCPGCHYQTLGFPHSNGFAIEPQFMGNLLIAPCLISLDLLCKKIQSGRDKQLKFLIFSSFIQLLALFICFSRGAIFSFAVAIILIASHAIYHKKHMRAVIYITSCIIAFLCGVLVQGIWAQISPTEENFIEGISRSVNQLSLGIIKIPTSSDKKSAPATRTTENSSTKEKAQFDGYIEESTTIRLDLNKLAIMTWKQDYRTIIFGVGFGGAGRAIREYTNTGSEREIVQNEFISLILEIGLLGISLLIILFISLCRGKKFSILFISILIAYLFSMNFYSGITNVWHIYLLTPVIYLLPGIRYSKTHMLK